MLSSFVFFPRIESIHLSGLRAPAILSKTKDDGYKNMDVSHVSTQFLDYCRNKGLSPHTLRAYRQDLDDYRRWLRRSGCADPIGKEAVAAWLSDMRDRDLSAASIKRRLACLKVMFRWLEDEGGMAVNPFHKLRLSIRLPRPLPRNLTRGELRELLSCAASESEKRPRDIACSMLRLAIELLFATGARVGWVPTGGRI